MRRVAVVSVLALAASMLASSYLPARSQAPALFEHFVGALHEHSGYSDGFPGSRPADYFQSAKWHGLDFLMSGEHSDNADVPMTFSEECLDETIADCAISDKDQPENSVRKWDATLEQAQAASDDSFTGIRGFEWSSDRFGHINVYFSEHDTNAKIDGGYGTMEAFWEWFARSSELGGGSDGLATFNHPGDKSLDGSVEDTDPGFNWNHFEYRPAADQRMVGIELYNDNDEYGEYYVEALDAGWHVGAIGAEDLGHRPRDGDGEDTDGDGVPDQNFDDDWGGPVWAKTVLIATDKTVEGLREAMLARRFYAVSDNAIRLEMTAGGRPMGSRISAPEGTTVPITASVNGAARLELITNGGVLAASADGTTLSFEAPVGTTETYYFLRVLDASGTPQAYSSPVWITAEDAAAGQWLAGDLHIHTTYSHDSYGGPSDDNTGPDEFYTLGHPVQSQFAVATARGLDYLAITDHNDIRSQTDPGWGFGGVIPVGGYENSLRGHAQMLGAHTCYSSTGPYPGPDCGEHGDTSAAGINATAAAIRADGGIFQINHPMEGTTDHGATPDWKYGYDVVPDTVEVWNISRLWQPPAPSASSNDDAIRYWEGFLDRGFKVGATGGADNHYLATTPVQGAGQPTTWVFATENTEAGVIEGLRAGRTFISHQPPNHGGPQIFLEADGDGDGTYESIVGDTVPAGSDLRARVVNGTGSLLSVFTDEGEAAFEGVPVTTPSFEHRFTLGSESTWVRVEIGEPDGADERAAACDGQFGGETTYCRNRFLVLAMTSALYLSEGADPDPTPTPTDPGETTYTSGTTYARVSEGTVKLGNDLVERAWTRDGLGTTAVTDKRDGAHQWGQVGADFHLDIGPASLASSDFAVSDVSVTELEGQRGPGLRVEFQLTHPAIDATRFVEVYDGIAGFRTRTVLQPKAPAVLSGYTLDELNVGAATPTIHAFRAGADWRDPENGWDGPQLSIGNAHPGTWRETTTAEAGSPLAGPSQWIDLSADGRNAFLVMERNDFPSSRTSYDGSVAALDVDLSRDIVSTGPFEESVHAENRDENPAGIRHRPLVTGRALALEPAFIGFGAHVGDDAWQFHKYLERVSAPYPTQVTFNSNGTDADQISTGAKDDMNYARVVSVAERAKALGVDTFILDDGWQANSGDWIPDCPGNQDYRLRWDPRFPDCDFTAVRDAIAPMKLGLWMSPMHFNPLGSQTYKDHPEWVCTPVGHGTAAASAADPDSGSNEAGIGMWGEDAITGGPLNGPDNLHPQSMEARIRNAIENWGVSYFKFDFLVWVDCAGQGDLYDYREAFMAMLDRLIADHPEVTFQIDETNDYRLFPFESVRRGPSWFQNGNPGPRTVLHNIWNLSPYVPASSLGQGFIGNGDARRDHGVDTLTAASLLSHMTYFSTLESLSEQEIATARRWIDFRKSNEDVLTGVVYPLLADPVDGDWTALQSWDPEAGTGALLAFRQDSVDPMRSIALENVPAGRRFDMFRAPSGEHIGTVTSEELRSGIEVAIPEQRGAKVFVFRPASASSPTPTPSRTVQGPAGTTLEFVDTASTGQYSDKVTFTAALTDDTGAPVAGQDVTFELVSAEGRRSFVDATDGDGIATVTTTLTERPGDAQLFASFAGNDDYEASGDVIASYLIAKEDSAVALRVSGKGSKRTLAATLTEDDGAIAGRPIEFSADGDAICRPAPTTDNDGRATCDPPPRYQGGKRDYAAVFPGDDFYFAARGDA